MADDAPRNVAQCQYRRQKYSKSQKITNNEINNMILLSFELHGFYKLLQLQPEILIVLMHDQMKQHFSNLLTATKKTIPLYYDTTFSLGEIYVSVLGFRHVMFSVEPMLPLAILMHDTKRESAHERFVQILHVHLPKLHEKCVLITDCEPAQKIALRTYYPTMLQFRCWSHATENLKYGVTKYYFNEQVPDAVDDDNDPRSKREIIAGVMDSITNLLRATSHTDLLTEYENISVSWPRSFREYFENNFLSTIDELDEAVTRMKSVLLKRKTSTTNVNPEAVDNEDPPFISNDNDDVIHAVHMNDPKRLFRCSCPSLSQTCSHVLAVKLFLGIPTDNSDNKFNLGHERKRKRIDDKITKPGDDLYSAVKQAYIDQNVPIPYPAANKQLQARLKQFVVKDSAKCRTISASAYDWFHKYLQEKHVKFDQDDLHLCASCTRQLYNLKEEVNLSSSSTMNTSPIESMETNSDELTLENIIYAGSSEKRCVICREFRSSSADMITIPKSARLDLLVLHRLYAPHGVRCYILHVLANNRLDPNDFVEMDSREKVKTSLRSNELIRLLDDLLGLIQEAMESPRLDFQDLLL
ncbi:unnamed protein product [Didymodactylos carnosus]|uniref:SWIM-type domain-containing protein n=1 Tax=Didymodactylos carnosus TaxID=1234261 RepID=A0A8S2DD97_9BILA|nr:unnamed protein product [Didymodactylos carnosus]CAF3659600.1 unnamed protein product [Didymodactylos carnosus]